MQENSKKIADENHKKLMTVVVVLLICVFALFGLAPTV